MTPAQLSHLRAIDAHLAKLLEQAKKRTPGEWTLGDENNSHYEVCIGDAVASIERQDRYGLHMVFSREEMRANGGFIIACAGNAEAGWKATRAVIKRYYDSGICRKWQGYMQSAIEPILAAFPLESLNS